MGRPALSTDPRRLVAKSAVLASLFAFVLTASFYVATAGRTYGFIDRGELAAVATTLGIAHPTGYPTLTLQGHFALRLFPSLRPVLVLNLLSALWTAAAVALATLVIHGVLQPAFLNVTDSFQPKKSTRKSPQTGQVSSSSRALTLACVSFFGAAFIGLSTTWWSQAAGFEVYSLHAVFLTLTTLTFLRYREHLRARAGYPAFSRWAVLFSFCLGLSFTNHLSTVMLAPAFLYLFFRVTRLNVRALQELARLAPGFVLGLLPYLYLPVRASAHPRLNWGAPDTWERFLAHVTGAQFHFAVLFETRVFRQQTQYFVNSLLSDTSTVGLVIAAVGLVILIRRARVHALWTVILFLTCAGISGLYDINDIGNYYLPAFLAVAVWVAAGLAFTAERFGRKAAFASGFLLLGLNLGRHYPVMDERENTLAEDLAGNVLQALPQRAVVFSNHWDYWVSGSLYAQEVEGLRQDVVVLDPEGLRSETYLEQLERNHPELMAPVRNETREFLEWIRKLSKNPRMARDEAEAYYDSYYRMVAALIERNSDRPFFVTEWTDARIGEGYLRVPTKLAYLLTKDTTYSEQGFPEYRFRRWTNRVDPYVVKVSEIYTTSLLARARYEEEHGRKDEGRRYGLYALTFDPGFAEKDVPDFPLHIEDQIVEVLRNYADLRERARGMRNRGEVR